MKQLFKIEETDIPLRDLLESIGKETIADLTKKKFAFIRLTILCINIINFIYPFLRSKSYLEKGLGYILAYQLVWAFVGLGFSYIMYDPQFEKHLTTIYHVFGLFVMIRMLVPLLDFENREAYMTTEEMSTFIITQTANLLMITQVGVFLKMSKVLIWINLLVISIIVNFG